MAEKTVVLIDGGFFVSCYRKMNGVAPRVEHMQPYLIDLLSKVKAMKHHPEAEEYLFRTFYYDCRPFGGTVTDLSGKKIDFSKSSVFQAASKFHRDLKAFPGLALRLGDLSFDGWKIDVNNFAAPPRPDFKQKSVDMKIGLDIAWMANKKVVDKLVLVAGDSDFIAPMKFARREGLVVYLYPMGHKMIKQELREHADFVL